MHGGCARAERLVTERVRHVDRPLGARPVGEHREGVQAVGAAQLPGAGVRLVEAALDLLEQPPHEGDGGAWGEVAREAGVEEEAADGEDHLAVDVVLHVLEGLVADPHRLLAAVALEPRQLALGRLAAARDRVGGLQLALGVSAPVAISAAANIFVGMVEAPLLVRPYLQHMSRGGLFATMTVGMSGVAGTVLALYAAILGPVLPGAAGHLIVASVISVPAALMLAELMVPQGTDEDLAKPRPDILIEDPPHSSMDAIAQGTREGIELIVNVTAMLIVIVALVALANEVIAVIGRPFGLSATLEQMLGWLFAPLAWLIGIPWTESTLAGSLLGIKTVLNELIAYLQLAGSAGEALSPRSRLILTYALCGFANLGSLGILIGGMVAMVPARRAEIVTLAARTLVSGTLATLMTAAVVGALTPP